MVRALSFYGCTILLILLCIRVEYKEDIADFLSLDSSHNEELKAFQNISGADNIFVVFQYVDSTKADIDDMIKSIDDFVYNVSARDAAHVIKNMTTQVDFDAMTNVIDFIYHNIPYFLTRKDYLYIDSVLSRDDYISEQLSQDKQLLMFPSSGLLAEGIQRDPLNLFSPVVRTLQADSEGLKYEMYEGYIFSPDMKRAIVMIKSPYGASETENNGRLIFMLRKCASATMHAFTNTEIHLIGSPVIAVGNATQIKIDSVLSVSCAMILILILLFVAFRNVRNLLLIALSICWGWLFGFGCLSLVHHEISIIVLGISSVVIGIAVNYPLHLIAHLSHTPNKRTALREIVSPLLVGNITTVGAFLALVPLRSVALRDLGLFSSFMLIGTIVFVLLYLPHMAKSRPHTSHTKFHRVVDISFDNKSYIVWIVVVLTVVFGYYSLKTKFDTNMANINYMTAEQKADMSYLQSMVDGQNINSKVYVISSGETMDEALDKSLQYESSLERLKKEGIVRDVSTCNQFVCSEQEQVQRLQLWKDFIHKYREVLETALRTQGEQQGFAQTSFEDFYKILDANYGVEPFEFFQPLSQLLFSRYLIESKDGGASSVVDVLTVSDGSIAKVEEDLKKAGIHAFDAISMNSAMANNLSNDFNYIGWACGCIVFFFLWLSLGSLELAILSFIPMAISWIWILGLMSIFGIQFNIVNIILATFIFGQGDDYTIFMTEGSCYEYAYRKKILGSYKNAIGISALIMFIGIGSLIIAKHPALHSLAEVTIVGMLSVVLMAYILPPLIFKWIVSDKGKYRIRPFSLAPSLVMAYCAIVFFSQLVVVYVLGFFLFVLLKNTEKRQLFFRRYIQRLYTFDFKHIYGVRVNIVNPFNEDFTRPSMIVSNHQSMLDAAIYMMVSPRFVLVSNEKVSNNLIIKQIYKWMGFVTLSLNYDEDLKRLKSLTQQGYSIVMFPEGERNPYSSILRFHKGAFYMAEQLNLDIVPIVLHGINHVLPRNSFCVYKGKLTINITQRIVPSNTDMGEGYVARTKKFHQYYVQEYNKLTSIIETTEYYKNLVLDRYRYKGYDVYHSVQKNLKTYQCYSRWIDNKPRYRDIVVVNNEYGEFALMYALVCPSIQVVAVMKDKEKETLLRFSAEGIVNNLLIVGSEEFTMNNRDKEDENYMVYILEPTSEIRKTFVGYKTTEIQRI